MKLIIGDKSYFNLILGLVLSILIGTLSSFNLNVLIILTVSSIFLFFLLYKFRTSTIAFFLLLLTMIPMLSSYGFNIVGIKISISDIYILFCLIYLLVFNSSIVKEKEKYNLYLPCLIVAIILMLYVPISISYNNPAEVLNIFRNIGYSIITYLVIISVSDYRNLQKKIMIISFAVSLYTIFTYFKIVGETNLYPLFRNAETFHVAMFCYFLIKTLLNENKKNLIINWCLISLLAVGIIVQQDRIQIIAIFISILITFGYLLIKKSGAQKKIAIFFIYVSIVIYLAVKIIYAFKIQSVIGLLENYYNYRIKVLFNNNGQLQNDTSLSIRSSQYENIVDEVSSSFNSMFFGKGLAAEYSNGIVIVDSFWLWIFLNMGILGLILFSYYLFTPLIKLLKVKHSVDKEWVCLFSAYIGSLVVTISIPNMIMRIDDSVTFGILFALIHLFINKEIRRKK